VTAGGPAQGAGLELPAPPSPAGLYAPCVVAGPLLFVSGQIAVAGGKVLNPGKCGAGVSVEAAAALARQCALQALAIVRAELGSLDQVRRVARVAGYVASAEGFTDHPEVINGASQLLIDVFGEAGRHARIALGVAELPRGAAVEVEFLFEVA